MIKKLIEWYVDTWKEMTTYQKWFLFPLLLIFFPVVLMTLLVNERD
jgi:hypothetical protein